jgi:SAM-dependent methyltransferase
MNPLQRTLSSASFRREHAQQFQDQCVVDVYHLRPPYPEETFSILARLVDPDCPRVLDVGCGTGEIARRMAPRVEHVDAVDFSPAMIAKGKRLAGGNASALHWIEGEAETVTLTPPYGLITAASSLHWMDWPVVLTRFAQILTPKGMLAIIYQDNSTPGLNLEALGRLVREYLTNPEYQPFDLVGELTQQGLFAPEGEAWTEPVPWEQSIPDYIGSYHTRNGFSRERMGPEASEAFDSAAAQILWTACPEGKIPMHLRARVVWGRPGRSGAVSEGCRI